VRIRRIVREYRDAGALNRLLALWGFIDDHTFLTKSGHVGVAYRLKGVDCEALTHAQRHALVHRFEAALRAFDDHWRLYQYLVKQRTGPFTSAACAQPVAQEAIQRRAAYLNGRREDLYDLALFTALVYEPPTTLRRSNRLAALWRSPRQVLHDELSTHRAVVLLGADLDRAIATLHQKAHTFEVQIADFGPHRLSKQELFLFFRRLVNYDPPVIAATPSAPDLHLDYFVADSPVECHRDHLVVGHRRVKALSMKEPPARTFAHVLADLCVVPGEFIACLEWQRLPSDRMRREIQMRRRHFFNKRVSMINYLSPEARPEEMLVDNSADETVRVLGDALTELEVNGHFFGNCSLTLILHGVDGRALETQTAEAMKALAVHDGSFF